MSFYRINTATIFWDCSGLPGEILYHSSDNDLANRKVNYTQEAKLCFHGTVYVPDDFDCVEL